MSITATTVRDWISAYAAVIAENRAELVKLDSAIGDGDHGTNMDRGMRKAVEKLEDVEGDDIGALLKAVGMALVSSVGGAAGPLYGTLFLQMGTASAGKDELDLAGWTEALEAGVKGVQARGKAEPGDKTMIDALAAGARGAARRRRRTGPISATRCAARPTPPGRGCARRSRSRRARDARATWVRAASATRTRARPRRTCCGRRRGDGPAMHRSRISVLAGGFAVNRQRGGEESS